jgi:tetratricopeptide (TPR) repeat protein
VKTHWYYVREDRVFGPISSSELRRKACEAVIDQTTPIRKGVDGPWLPARRVQGLFVPADQVSPKLPNDKSSRPAGAVEARQADPSGSEPDSSPSAAPGGSTRQLRWRGFTQIVGAAAAVVLFTSLLGIIWSMRNRDKGPADSSVVMQTGRKGGQEIMPSVTSSDTANAAVDDLAVQPADEAPAPDETVADDRMLSDPARPLALAPADNNPNQATESPPKRASVPKPEPASLAEGLPSDPRDENVGAGPTGRPAAPEAVAASGVNGLPGDVKPATLPNEIPSLAPAKAPAEAEGVRPNHSAEPQQEDERLAMLWKIYEENPDHFQELIVNMRQLQVLEEIIKNKRQQWTVLAQRLQEIRTTGTQIQKEIVDIKQAFGPNTPTPNHTRRLLVLSQENAKISEDLMTVQSDLREHQKTAQGILQVIKGQVSAADKVLEECFPLYDPYGRLHELAQRRTVESLSRWILQDTEFPPFYLARGFAYVHLGSFDRALEDFGRATELYPRMVGFTAAARGYALARQGKIRDAWHEFDRAQKLNPRLAVIYVFKGYGFLAQQNHSNAEKQFLQALRYDKNATFALHGLAYLWSTRHHASLPTQRKAIEHAKRACELTKWRDWACVDTLAMAFAAAGEFESAVQTAKQALHITPTESRAEVERRLRLYQAGKPYRIK